MPSWLTPSPNTTRRKLTIGIIVAGLFALTIVIADLATGGHPDPSRLRAAATLLNGNWKFHVGDNPHWAETNTNDLNWGTINLTAAPGSTDGDVGLPDYVSGWEAQGHPGYHGYAWYRLEVTVPANTANWAILGPTIVEDGYELYWNGKLLGGSGRLGPLPRFVGTRPLEFDLPADAAGTTGVIAVRAFMLPRSGGSTASGGMHTAPFLAPKPVADALHRVQWERTIAGYIVEVVEPLAMFALIGLALWYYSHSDHKGFLIFTCVALALTGARRLNNAIVSWTDLMDLNTYSWLALTMWIPTMAAWVLAWNRWCQRSWRSIDILAVALAICAFVGTLDNLTTWINIGRVGTLALFVVIAARIVRSGLMRVLALVTLASIMAGLFGHELLGSIGVPGIWFPFGIGVSRTQYVYAISIPLLAFLIVQTLIFGRRQATDSASLESRSGLA